MMPSEYKLQSHYMIQAEPVQETEVEDLEIEEEG
jgi:hypothetical protein